MNEQECLSRMVAPGTRRKGKYREGVIQIHVTRACDKACFGCTQGSNFAGRVEFMSPEHFESAVKSLKGYYGVYGVFGGNPALSPHFEEYCKILQRLVPFNQRGLWCNHPKGKGKLMAATFDPSVSNINVHLDGGAAAEFRRDWPQVRIVGEHRDSRHSPPFVAMRDVVRKQCPQCEGEKYVEVGSILYEASVATGRKEDWRCPMCKGLGTVPDTERIHELISGCDINQHWSAMIGVFRGQLRAWFCEIAGAQSILHQWDRGPVHIERDGYVCDREGYTYPDTGLDPTAEYEHYVAPDVRVERTVGKWWELGMHSFAHQVRKHCHECGIPLRGFGELSQAAEGKEETSATHADVAVPKRRRTVSLLTVPPSAQVGKVTDYVRNGG